MPMRMRRTLRTRWTCWSFGFPVTLRQVPMIQLLGVWTPDVDFQDLQPALLAKLVLRQFPLTGLEVRFIRHSFKLTLQAFALRFGVTHPAVIKWEQAGNRRTGMTWTTEKDLRLCIIEHQGGTPAEFLAAYQALRTRPSATERREMITLEAIPPRTRKVRAVHARRKVRLG